MKAKVNNNIKLCKIKVDIHGVLTIMKKSIVIPCNNHYLLKSIAIDIDTIRY